MDVHRMYMYMYVYVYVYMYAAEIFFLPPGGWGWGRWAVDGIDSRDTYVCI